MSTATTTRPKMTAAEATHFDGHSTANAATILLELECDCQPYEDVFTYARWKAQGFQVQKGEKSIRIPTIQKVTKENDKGEPETRRLKKTSFVFCRCQVKPIEQ